MSDFYDSLEEESEDDKLSLESFSGLRAKSSTSVGRLYSRSATEKYSFFLNENATQERINLLPIFHSRQDTSDKKNFLPKIDLRPKEKSPPSNFFIDSHALEEQGLQLNKDGSFTKSPRPTEEKLPFITREYRNLQFQKKKTWTIKNPSPAKAKNSASLTKNLVDGMNANQIVNTKKQNHVSEELLKSESLSHSKNPEKLSKTFARNHNMTDSMKEKLLIPVREKQKTETPQEPKGKKVVEASESHKQKKNPVMKKKTESPQKENLFKEPPNVPKGSLKDTRKPKNVAMKIPKFQSDILIKIPKSKLSYSEQHQLKKGYNPFSLKHDAKKVTTDTNRSNFGDSVMEELPEISSRYLSCSNLDNEDEEKFYQKLIEMDKHRRKIQCSARSDGFYQLESLRNLKNPSKGQKEVLSGRSNGRFKPATKSQSIDMPPDTDHSTKTLKKFSHYCSPNSSRTSSKVELAIKARTYGYLVNARNIFKFKAQSEAKLNEAQTGKNLKNNGKIFPLAGKSLGLPQIAGKLPKQNSLPENGFLAVKEESLRYYQNLPRVSASCCTAGQSEKFQKDVSCGEDVVVPQVEIS